MGRVRCEPRGRVAQALAKRVGVGPDIRTGCPHRRVVCPIGRTPIGVHVEDRPIAVQRRVEGRRRGRHSRLGPVTDGGALHGVTQAPPTVLRRLTRIDALCGAARLCDSELHPVAAAAFVERDGKPVLLAVAGQVHRLGVRRIPVLGRHIAADVVLPGFELATVLGRIDPQQLVVVTVHVELVRPGLRRMEDSPPHLGIVVAVASRPDLGVPDCRAAAVRRQVEQPAVLAVGHTVVDVAQVATAGSVVASVVQRVEVVAAGRIDRHEALRRRRPTVVDAVGRVTTVVVGHAVVRRDSRLERLVPLDAERLDVLPCALVRAAVGPAPVDVDVGQVAGRQLARQRRLADCHARARVVVDHRSDKRPEVRRCPCLTVIVADAVRIVVERVATQAGHVRAQRDGRQRRDGAHVLGARPRCRIRSAVNLAPIHPRHRLGMPRGGHRSVQVGPRPRQVCDGVLDRHLRPAQVIARAVRVKGRTDHFVGVTRLDPVRRTGDVLDTHLVDQAAMALAAVILGADFGPAVVVGHVVDRAAGGGAGIQYTVNVDVLLRPVPHAENVVPVCVGDIRGRAAVHVLVAQPPRGPAQTVLVVTPAKLPAHVAFTAVTDKRLVARAPAAVHSHPRRGRQQVALVEVRAVSQPDEVVVETLGRTDATVGIGRVAVVAAVDLVRGGVDHVRLGHVPDTQVVRRPGRLGHRVRDLELDRLRVGRRHPVLLLEEEPDPVELVGRQHAVVDDDLGDLATGQLVVVSIAAQPQLSRLRPRVVGSVVVARQLRAVLPERSLRV